MAKFDAGEMVEPLDYDFTKFNGGEGTITEPSTGMVNDYMDRSRAMLREVQALQRGAEEISPEDLTDEQMAEAMAKIDEKSAGAREMQEQTLVNLALLCGAELGTDGKILKDTGAPSYRDLSRLPYRVLQEFNKWLVGEISPKRERPAPPR